MGYSLAELLVAVAIFSLTILAIVAVLRKGSELTVTDLHRKRAQALVDSCFESGSYQGSNYANLAGASRAVLIDPRNESNSGDDLSGALTITVAVDTNKASGTNIEYKRVTASVQWTEPEGAQTITLQKYLTAL
jgi:type II secretory pathway pseudopilin PulG